MAKKRKEKNVLADFLDAAPHKVLKELILNLALESPEVRWESFEFLKSQVSVSNALKQQSEGEIILSIWYELEPDLADLDDSGGGDYSTADHVADLLDEIREHLDTKKVGPNYRRDLLDQVLPYIKSGNAGLDDMLYEVAYAACYNDEDLRNLAKAFEKMGSDWQVRHARDIYRRIGDRDKYLELRLSHMDYGGDYYDLATFYWESGEKEKALQVSEKGLKKGRGRMDELRNFIAEKAEESGNQEKFITIQFEQATDCLTFEKYKAFKKICTKQEWTEYEPKIMLKLKDAWSVEQLKIHMHRKAYDHAIKILSKMVYPNTAWDDDYKIKAAQKLEKRYPEKVLKYYHSGLGNLTTNATRKEYAHKAKVMAKVHHMLLDVIGDEARWKKFVCKVKKDNIRRPAFQQEFAKAVPGWKELN